jgi:hypothetical protein
LLNPAEVEDVHTMEVKWLPSRTSTFFYATWAVPETF